MPRIAAKEIAGYAAGAGFKGDALNTAVAVALAESGGRTDAVGDTTLTSVTWGPSVGLWQIRSLNADLGTGASRDAARLADPGFNARSAYAISKGGTNWSPWTVFTTGAFLLKLTEAKRGVAANSGRVLAPTGQVTTPTQMGEGVPGWVSGALPAVASSTADAVQDLTAYPARVLAWVSDRNNIIRIVKVVLGVGLAGIGLYVVSRPVQKQVGDTVKTVVGVAGAARGAVKPKAAPKAA